MKKSLITFSIVIIVLVIGYFAYDLLKTGISPCESIFQQTSLKLGSKLDIIKAKGDIFIGEEKIQDLTERSQMTALNLKTCCIVLEGGKVNSEEFLRCKDNAEKFETQVEKVATVINEAQEAKQEGKSKLVDEKLNQINQTINVAQASSDNLNAQVTNLKTSAPTEKTEKGAPSSPGEQEPNNTVFEANSFPIDTTVSGEISSQDDQDYFRFRNTSKLRDLAKVKLENQSTSFVPDIYVYDSNKSQRLEKFDGTPGANLEFKFDVEPEKEYYIRVIPSYGSSGKYNLSLNLEKAYDKYEPNDTISSPKLIRLGEPIEANILSENDVDCYLVSGITGKSITVRLENKSAALRPDIMVYNSNKSQLFEKFDPTPGANLDFAFDVEPGMNYYIKINPYGSTGEYTLTVDQQ